MYLLCGNNNPTFFFSLSFIPAKIPAKTQKRKNEKKEEKKSLKLLLLEGKHNTFYFFINTNNIFHTQH
jgi:rRNA pseudouridine-1189 N-methylase Emg1 (Nep1/Mra1 family)